LTTSIQVLFLLLFFNIRGLCRIDVWEEILPGEWFSLFWVIYLHFPPPPSPSPPPLPPGKTGFNRKRLVWQNKDRAVVERRIPTINVPVVYMVRHVTVLSASMIHYEGHWIGRGGSGIRDFFGPSNGYERSECHLVPK
jgi:hypothetical protein